MNKKFCLWKFKEPWSIEMEEGRGDWWDLWGFCKEIRLQIESGVIIYQRGYQIPLVTLPHKKWKGACVFENEFLSFQLPRETIFAWEWEFDSAKIQNIKCLGVVQLGGECWILELTGTLLSILLTWTGQQMSIQGIPGGSSEPIEPHYQPLNPTCWPYLHDRLIN